MTSMPEGPVAAQGEAVPVTVDPPEPVKPVSFDQRRLLAGGLCVLAALLATVGTFLPLFVAELDLGRPAGIKLTVTGWGMEATSPAIDSGGGGGGDRSQPTAPNGYPLALASFLLLTAGIAAFWSARQAATEQGARFTRVLTLGGTAFLAGAVLTVAMQGVGYSSTLSLLSAGGSHPSLGLGFWLLIVGFVAAATAAVLMHLPSGPQQVRPAGEPVGERDIVIYDVSTPRYGVPVQQEPETK